MLCWVSCVSSLASKPGMLEGHGSVAAQRKARRAVKYDAGASSMRLSSSGAVLTQRKSGSPSEDRKGEVVRSSAESQCRGQHDCAVRPVLPASVTAKGCPCEVVLVAKQMPCKATLVSEREEKSTR